MRLSLAASFIAACSFLPCVTLAALPTPGLENVGGGGSAYVGTVNPPSSPPPTLPPIDFAPVTVTTTDGPGGSKVVEVSGGTFDVVHFGVGQAFTGVAGIDAFMVAEVGSIHLAASAGANTTPFGYEAPFPGALGENPFYAQAFVNIGAGFVDVVTLPATAAAPNPGDLTTANLEVLASCSLNVEDGSSDFTGFVSADLSLADGTDLGAVATRDPVIFSPEDPVCPFGAHPDRPALRPQCRAIHDGRARAGRGSAPGHTQSRARGGLPHGQRGHRRPQYRRGDAHQRRRRRRHGKHRARLWHVEWRPDDHDNHDDHDDHDLRAALHSAGLHGLLR
jgi:hypothetical protein